MIRKVICPECGADMVFRQTAKFKFRNGGNKVFYGCSRYPACTCIMGSHPDGTPYGVPADKETKEWRVKAHQEFDRLWKSYRYTRHQAYEFLANIMQIPLKDAHISNFNKEQCQKLLEKLHYKITT